jgi:hypothetical protein
MILGLSPNVLKSDANQEESRAQVHFHSCTEYKIDVSNSYEYAPRLLVHFIYCSTHNDSCFIAERSQIRCKSREFKSPEYFIDVSNSYQMYAPRLLVHFIHCSTHNSSCCVAERSQIRYESRGIKRGGSFSFL